MAKKSSVSSRTNSSGDQRRVQSIGSLVSELISRRGYAQSAASDQFRKAIVTVIGDGLADEITVGKLNRGVLKIFANDSVTVQELTFQKRQILAAINATQSQARVKDLRFAVQQQ